LKKLFIILFLLVFLVIVAVGGGLAYAIMNANAIAKQYKPELEKMASDALGSKVTFGDISAKVFPTARLAISKAQLESGGEKLTLDRLSLNVALMPLLQRDLQVKELVLDTPKITIYLEKDGFYIAGLPRKRPAEAAPKAGPADAAPAAAGSTTAPLSVTLERVALKNATIALVDKTANKTHVIKKLGAKAALAYDGGVVLLSSLDGGMTILDNVDLKFGGKDATLNLEGGAFDISEATAKALGNTFKVTGGIDPDDSKKALRITSDRVDLASLGPFYDVFAPGINDLGIKGLCRPDLTVAWTPEGAYRANGTVGISEASWTVADIPLTKMEGTLRLDATDKGAKVTTNDTKGLLRDAPFTLAVDSGLKDKKAGLETVTAKIFGGTGTLNTSIELEGDMPFKTKLSLNDMKIEQALPALLPDNTSNINGTIKEMSGDITGTFNDKLMPSIKGNAKMHLADGLIKDVNLGKEVLGGVTEIPFVQGTLLNAVPEGMRNLISKPHTALESMTATYAIANEQLNTEDLHIQSDYFTMDAKGTIGFDTKLDLAAMIYFNKDFSGGMATMVKEIGVLFDDQGRLAFPVKIKGIPPNLTVLPDVGDLIKRAATGVVKQEVQKQVEKAVGGEVGGLVNKLLGGDKKAPAAPENSTATAPEGATPPAQTAPAAPAQEPTAAPEEEVKKTVEKTVGGLLKRLGGKNP
jgi:hypothetical protein